jgi:hypothetical protein
MAFVLEDGTGVAGANAYIDRAFADTYHTDRGFSAWEFSDTAQTVAITNAQKEAAIVRATDHIDRVYGQMFRGYKGTRTQGLQWPRTSAWDPDGFELLGVPIQLQNATAEYALRALLQGVLTPDPPPMSPQQTLVAGASSASFGQGSGEVVRSKKKVGPIETETEFAQSSRSQSSTYVSSQLENYPAADMMLRGLLESRNRQIVRG